tara:strand:+ start:86 stop:1420 length:1335 start_codon:yes stop_codon:yes gene_type:complete
MSTIGEQILKLFGGDIGIGTAGRAASEAFSADRAETDLKNKLKNLGVDLPRNFPEQPFLRPRPKTELPTNMPGAIEYPDFFYTPEGKFINPMGPSRIVGGTPGRAEEGFGRGKGREGPSIATMDLSQLSVEDLIDLYGISREQAEKVVEFNKNEMLKRVNKDDLLKRFMLDRNFKRNKSENNLLDAILPFISPGVGTSGIMNLMSKKEKAGRGRLQDGGRIGFGSGTRDGRTVGMSQNRVTQLLALREEAINKDDRDKIIEIDQELSMMGFITPKAFGGRIGFQDGRRVRPVEIPGPAQEMEMLMKQLMEGGLSREDAEKEAEIILFGPSAMKRRDSKGGLGSMMAGLGDDEDEYKSPPFIDDPEGRMETDEFEAIRQIIESGALTKLDDDELRRMYDSMVESEAGIKLLEQENINSFEEYKDFISRIRKRPQGIENVMPTMVA